MPAYVWLLVAMVLLVYVCLPLRLWRRLQLGEEDVQTVEADALPKAAAEFFDEIAPAMRQLGFEQAAYVRSALPRLDGYQSLWLNRSCGHAAVHGVVMTNFPPTVKVYSLEFQTELEDGVAIRTNNFQSRGLFIGDPSQQVMRFPQVDDVALLHKLHTWHERQRASPALARYQTPAGREVEELRKGWRAMMQLQVAAGRFKKLEGQYVPTLRGAFLLQWKLLPPMKQIRVARDCLQARRWMAQAQKEPVAMPVGVRITDRDPKDISSVPRPIDRRWS